MNTRSLALTAALIFTPLFAGAARGDPLVGYDATSGHWYRIVRVSNGINWGTARGQAQTLGGDLAIITSAGEQALISAVAVNATGLWLGGQQNLGSFEPGGGWSWLTSEPFTYTNWDIGQPDNLTTNTSPPANEDRLIMGTFGGQWNDVAASLNSPDQTSGFVVESTTLPAPVVWSGNGHGYLFVLYRTLNADVIGGLTWNQANTLAGSLTWQGHQGYLATVTSAAEWSFITGALGVQMRDGLWLGGRQMDAGPEPAGGWMWVTGEPWSFTSWLQTLPDDNRGFFGGNTNEDRLITGSSNGNWNDLSQLDNRTADTVGLIIEFGATATSNCGAADIGSQGGASGADGALDNNDFIVYIDRFFTNTPSADVGRQGGVPGSDGLFDNNDFIVFIGQFFSGSC